MIPSQTVSEECLFELKKCMLFLKNNKDQLNENFIVKIETGYGYWRDFKEIGDFDYKKGQSINIKKTELKRILQQNIMDFSEKNAGIKKEMYFVVYIYNGKKDFYFDKMIYKTLKFKLHNNDKYKPNMNMFRLVNSSLYNLKYN